MKLHRNFLCCAFVLARNLPLLCSQRTACVSDNTASGFSAFSSSRPQCRYRDKDRSAGVRPLSRNTHSTMSGSSSEDCRHHNVQCLRNLMVDNLHQMDVIVAGLRQQATEHVIFFGGDVQDYPENMESHRDNGRYVRWNSIATATRLSQRFPSAMVMVIMPHHMHLKTFSVYSQFVQSNDFGCPTHTPDDGAWRTLIAAYSQVVSLALQGQDAEAQGHSSAGVNTAPTDAEKESMGAKCNGDPSHPTAPKSSSVDKLQEEELSFPSKSASVHLIGFSKGCIVLNQLVHELDHVQSDEAVQAFISNVSTMTWLDGGHSGGRDTWVTNPAVLNRLAATGIEVVVHVTPYQVKDEMRRWIGKEKRRFVDLLQKAGAKVSDTLHFEDEPKSIENHFRVLEVF